MENAALALATWLTAESSPLLAGFIGGVIAQAVVLLAARGKSDMPRAIRIQIVLIWIVIGVLLLINVNQGQNIAKLIEAARP